MPPCQNCYSDSFYATLQTTSNMTSGHIAYKSTFNSARFPEQAGRNGRALHRSFLDTLLKTYVSLQHASELL